MCPRARARACDHSINTEQLQSVKIILILSLIYIIFLIFFNISIQLKIAYNQDEIKLKKIISGEIPNMNKNLSDMYSVHSESSYRYQERAQNVHRRLAHDGEHKQKQRQARQLHAVIRIQAYNLMGKQHCLCTL